MLRPGMMAVPMPIAPVMVFVHAEEHIFVAALAQNVITNVDPGDEVEVAIRAIPGTVFSGEVIDILPVTARGQLSPSGRIWDIPTPPGRQSTRIPVLIKLTDERLAEYKLPAGTMASAAVYTGRLHHLNILRKLILRIGSWENYVFAP
jgi:multidrug resistance efflux pump